jgi:hypothetical protein
LFVFNDLTSFSLRPNRKRQPGAHGTREPAYCCLLKDSSTTPAGSPRRNADCVDSEFLIDKNRNTRYKYSLDRNLFPTCRQGGREEEKLGLFESLQTTTLARAGSGGGFFLLLSPVTY